MGKILAFIYEDMADFELTFATHLLGMHLKKRVITIGYDSCTVKSKPGIIYQPEMLVKDVLEEEVDGLIIPGGWNGEIRPELIELITNLHAKEKLLAAICAGPRFLAKAGVLDNVKYTTSLAEWSEAFIKQFQENDPFPRQNFVKARVMRDKHIITADGIAFVDFALEIADYFGLFPKDEDKINFSNVFKGI